MVPWGHKRPAACSFRAGLRRGLLGWRLGFGSFLPLPAELCHYLRQLGSPTQGGVGDQDDILAFADNKLTLAVRYGSSLPLELSVIISTV